MARTHPPGLQARSVRHPGLLLLATCGAQFMVIVDDTVVNVALPSIRADLNFTGASLAWVVDAYMLLFGGFLLLSGRAADLLGRRRVFLAGLAVFTAASLAAGLAGSPEVLIAARAAQGFGGALLGPSALSILLTAFTEPAARRRALGAWGGLSGISAMAGVLLGGVVTDGIGWRWVFFINVPVGVLMAAAILVSTPGLSPGRDDRSPSLDAPGAVLVTGGLLLLVYSVIGTSHRPWDSPVTIGGLAAAAALLAMFVVRESRAAEPLIPLWLFTRRRIALANVGMLCTAAGMFAIFFFLTQYMQIVHGWSPMRTGLSWLPFGALFAVCSGLSVQLTPRFGGRTLVLAGLVVAAVGQLLLVRTTPDGSYAGQLLPALLLGGAGFGLAFVPLFAAAVGEVRTGESGAVSGLLATAQQVGGAIGVAALATLASHRFEEQLRAAAQQADAMTSAFHAAFLTAAALTAVAALVALALPPLREEVDLAAIQGA